MKGSRMFILWENNGEVMLSERTSVSVSNHSVFSSVEIANQW